MRTARTLAVCALTAAALALPTAASFAAGNEGQIEANPSRVRPGGTVTLSTAETTCPKDSSIRVSEQNKGWSATLTKGTMSLVGTLRVPSTAKAGTYTVVGSCPTGGLIVAGEFTVVGTAVPTGSVSTGLGGGSSDGNTAEIAGGAALAAVALGGAVYLRRRAAAQRG
ncbi:hypothetical protein ABUW04_01380 [Streptacidiphilus sp. N1-10]|uniref:LPXTG cell wall anchor domain-containing protein n=1 Tax=Streptacidiphilus jeojiensis TaxID=3229225 RepID=A0ABV6XFU4_9ACTN